MAAEDDSMFEVGIVYLDYEATAGEKGIGTTVRRAALKLGVLDTTRLAETLSAFSHELGAVFDEVATEISRYELETVEVTVEVTARGEVRLIGSAGAEVTGGLKLVFSRRRDGE